VPRRDPFTQLCQTIAGVTGRPIADLHTHTTASDGEYTPSQLVAHASRTGLTALAVTDHDSISGLAEARTAAIASRRPFDVLTGVEVTTRHEGHEVHLLGYFFDPSHESLLQMLEAIRSSRRRRFQAIFQWLGSLQVVPAGYSSETIETRVDSLTRRHVASALLDLGVVPTRHEAFRRYLHHLPDSVPELELPTTAEAIAVLRSAGGITSLAHPAADVDSARLEEFAATGLAAVEVDFPNVSYSRSQELRRAANELGLRTTGGSDCHGPDRPLGGLGVSRQQLTELRRS
jgi:3',5'-nucleoside bisphosphate phosphatase